MVGRAWANGPAVPADSPPPRISWFIRGGRSLQGFRPLRRFPSGRVQSEAQRPVEAGSAVVAAAVRRFTTEGRDVSNRPACRRPPEPRGCAVTVDGDDAWCGRTGRHPPSPAISHVRRCSARSFRRHDGSIDSCGGGKRVRRRRTELARRAGIIPVRRRYPRRRSRRTCGPLAQR